MNHGCLCLKCLSRFEDGSGVNWIFSAVFPNDVGYGCPACRELSVAVDVLTAEVEELVSADTRS